MMILQIQKKLGAAWTFRGLLSSKEKFVMPGANLKENFVCDERHWHSSQIVMGNTEATQKARSNLSWFFVTVPSSTSQNDQSDMAWKSKGLE